MLGQDCMWMKDRIPLELYLYYPSLVVYKPERNGMLGRIRTVVEPVEHTHSSNDLTEHKPK